MDLSFITYLFIIVTPFFLLYVTSKYFTSTKNLPPGPPPLPIIGNLHQIGKMPHVSTAMFAKTYGPIISFRIVSQNVVVVSSAEAAMEVLKTQDHNLSGRMLPDILRQPIKDFYLIGSPDCNDYWKSLRSHCRTNMLSVKAIEAQSKLRSEKLTQMRDFLEQKQGKVVRIDDVVFTTAFNTLSNIIFSKDFLSLNDEHGTANLYKLALQNLLENNMTPNVSDLFPVLRGLDIQGLRRDYTKNLNQISSFTEKLIDERRERNSTVAKEALLEEEKDFLDHSLESNMTNAQINILVVELFVAGTDTVASTIEWFMAELLKNKHVMHKVQDELKKGIISNSINSIMETDFSTFSYFSACIKETLRLHPVVPLLLPRRAVETCEVMGYTIPKNSQVWVNIWAISRDPHVWEDPNSFNPERFLSTNLDFTRHEFKFTPFGGGRRMCPGLRYGIKSLETVLASLILGFDWVLPNILMTCHVIDVLRVSLS
ncbi:cytochrome P450, partial [Tanacetum coccineum]